MALKSILKALGHFGVQGALDQASNTLIGGVMKGASGFVTGAFRGIAGMEQSVKNIGAVHKFASKAGYGAGKVAGAPFRFAFNKATGNPTDGSWFDTIGEKAINYGKDIARGSTRFFDSVTTTENADKFKDLGIGLFGRRVKPGVAWGITAGATLYGIASAGNEHSMNLGLQTAINGPMDTQMAAVAPGSITNTYTPLHVVGDAGVEGLGFALHNARNTGYL